MVFYQNKSKILSIKVENANAEESLQFVKTLKDFGVIMSS